LLTLSASMMLVHAVCTVLAFMQLHCHLPWRCAIKGKLSATARAFAGPSHFTQITCEPE